MHYGCRAIHGTSVKTPATILTMRTGIQFLVFFSKASMSNFTKANQEEFIGGVKCSTTCTVKCLPGVNVSEYLVEVVH